MFPVHVHLLYAYEVDRYVDALSPYWLMLI
jgi:hypothetical protein